MKKIRKLRKLRELTPGGAQGFNPAVIGQSVRRTLLGTRWWTHPTHPNATVEQFMRLPGDEKLATAFAFVCGLEKLPQVTPDFLPRNDEGGYHPERVLDYSLALVKTMVVGVDRGLAEYPELIGSSPAAELAWICSYQLGWLSDYHAKTRTEVDEAYESLISEYLDKIDAEKTGGADANGAAGPTA